MSRILSLTLAIAVLIGITILVLGYTSLPKYQGKIEFEVDYSVNLIWQELLNIQQIPERKSDVKSVQILEEFGKLFAWQENLNNGGYRIYRMNKRDENQLLIIELTESSYGLTGVWTFELFGHRDGTTISISEDSALTDIKRRGYRVIMGREVDLLTWQKYIRAGVWQSLLKTP